VDDLSAFLTVDLLGSFSAACWALDRPQDTKKAGPRQARLIPSISYLMLNDCPRQWNPLRAVGGIVGEIQGRSAEAQVVGIEVDRNQATLAGCKPCHQSSQPRAVQIQKTLKSNGLLASFLQKARFRR
jgi:hypothetical protein